VPNYTNWQGIFKTLFWGGVAVIFPMIVL